jgi:uncharacterized membrane protein YdjX (TVP38/TMEM64 family)
MLRPTKPQVAVFVILAVLALLVVALLYRRYGAELPPMAELREGLLGFLQSIPAPLYFVAFAILPAFGAPLTLFYLTALPVLGQVHPVIGVLLAWCALAINMTMSYWLAVGVLHPAIEWVIRHRHLKIPKINPANEVEITVAVRISPLPFPVQNYLLALGHARWRSYLFLSLPIQGCIGIAMMFLGESILRGRIGYVMLAIFAILVIALLIKAVRKRLNRDPVQTID